MSSPEVGTVFPALDGSDPGEQDPGQNITGVHLPTADSPPEGPTPEQLLDVGDKTGPGTEIQTDPTTPEVQGRKSNLQTRINRLVQRRNEAEGQNTELSAQLNTVTQQLEQTQTQLAQLANRAPAVPQTAPAADPMAVIDGSPAPVPVGNAAQQALTVEQVATVVREQIAPLYQQQQQTSEATRLSTQHAASFEIAADDFPDLRKPESKFRQLFNELYDSSPLRVLANAPYQLALQTQGLLSSEKRDAASSVNRKVAAGVHTPTPSAMDVGDADPSPLARKDVKDALAKAKHKMRLGTADFNDQKLVRFAGRKEQEEMMKGKR